MKLLSSLSLAFGLGCVAICVMRWLPRLSKPRPDVLTQKLRQFMAPALNAQLPVIIRYRKHLEGLLSETPLPAPMDVPLFIGAQLLCGLFLWIWVLCAVPGWAVVGLPLCMGLGGLGTYRWLIQHQKAFHTQLLKALPACLELLAIVMESGLDLTAGLQQYIAKGPTGPLRQLLKETQNDIQMGLSRMQAFTRLSQRTSFGPLRDVCRGIVQSLTLGTSLAAFLNRQAQALRTRRMHIAEKKAAEAPLKILFPLFVFIFPTIFVVLLGPLVLLFAKGGF